MNTITLTVGPDRPDYLTQTLDALARCDGRSEWRLYVIADSPSPEVDDVLAAHDDAIDRIWDVEGADTRDRAYTIRRISANVHRLWNEAFRDGADTVLHLEGDIVLAPDALHEAHVMAHVLTRFPDHAWAAGLWGVGEPGDPTLRLVLRPFLYPWGLIVTKVRWAEVGPQWDFEQWDAGLQRLRGDRLMVYPLISRAQSIGRIGTTPEGMAAHNPTFGVAA